MKRFLYLAAVLFSTQSHASNAINAAQCTLHGSNLWIPSKGAYDEIIVTSFAPKSSVAIALVEKVKNGSYLTYAHINIGLTERPEKTSLEIDVSSSAGTAHVEMEKGEGLKSKISFPPRIGEEMLVVNIDRKSTRLNSSH